VAHGELAEVLVFCDQNAVLVDAERGDTPIARARLDLEHIEHIVACSAKRCDKARIAALVREQLHGSARITAHPRDGPRRTPGPRGRHRA
jgi:hypothetical protein